MSTPERPFQHFLLTRFNVRVPWMNRPAPGPEWLAHRFDLFERFCLPSVEAQSNTDFLWLVFFDSRTPAEFRERISSYRKLPQFRAVFLDEFDLQLVRDAMRQHSGSDSRSVLTSRLDNDDALARSYIAKVQEVAYSITEPKAFISIRLGYTCDHGRAYCSEYVPNAFFSLLEPFEEMSTGYAYNHHDIAKHAPVRVIDGYRGWMQVVHDANHANVGPSCAFRVRRSTLRNEFPPALAEGSEPAVGLLANNARFIVRRFVRDSGRMVRDRLGLRRDSSRTAPKTGN
ncbi:MAG: glycosyltransferase [Planctomycetaceae bacterium]